MKSQAFGNNFSTIAFFAIAFAFSAAFFAFAPAANAWSDGTGSSGGSCCGGGYNTNDNGPWENTPPRREIPPPPRVTPPPTCTMSVTPTSIEHGQSATLKWSSTNAVSAVISNSITSASRPVSGSLTVKPVIDASSITYSGIFTGSKGQKVTCKAVLTFKTVEHQAPICDLSATPSRIEKGDKVKISWDSTNARAGSINKGIGSVGPDGSIDLYPSETTTYTGTFYGSNNKEVTCSTTVLVDEKPPHHDNDKPSCDLSVSDSSIERGDKVTLYWESEDAEYGKINQGIGRVDEHGSEKIYPKETTTYTGTFYDNDGDFDTCKVTVKVAREYNPPVYNAPQAPYISLSAVPYTGLDLGPVGTAVYWSFLVLWALLAAYLIAVRQLHTAIYRWLKAVLFGEAEYEEQIVAMRHISTVRPAMSAPASLPTSDIDPFILAQINRKIK